MVRPAFVLVLVIALGASLPAHAAGVARVMGMYPTAAPTAPLPMLDSQVEVVVTGPIVETVVTQRFHNRSDRAIEATYIFPLPPDAAVTAMSIRTGARTIRAAIEKREDALQRYEAAVRAGVTAAVLDQERPDVFTQTVAAIPARGTVEVVVRYDTLARYSDGSWALALPMVVAPRYVPGTASGRPTTGTGRAPDTDRAPDASRVTPHAAPRAGGATTVTIAFADRVTDVTSPTHDLTPAPTSERTPARYTLVDPHSDRDAVIRWRAAHPAAGWVEASKDGGYAAVVVEAGPPPARKGPVRLVLVLHGGATMRGDATIVGAPFVRALLAELGDRDRVAVAGAVRLPWSAPADVQRALGAGATSIASPRGAQDLTRVLRELRVDGAPLVLVSDGLVADDRAVLAAAKQLGVPVHVIGVGAAPARGLLVQLAASTGGTVRFALPGDDLVAYAKATILDVASPPAPLTVTWGTLVARDVVPGVLPRLGAGQAMLVLARVQRAHGANARARGQLFAIERTVSSRTAEGATTREGPLARRWARMRLDDLLVGGVGKADRAKVTAHALAFGLVSPFTSLVAIGDEVVVSGGVRHSVPVPVSVPAGMRWQEVKRETTVELPVDASVGGEISGDAVTTKATSPVPATSAPAEPAGDLLDARASGADDVEEEVYDASMSRSQIVMTSADATGSESIAFHDHRAWRIAASLGVGLALGDGDTAPYVALGARVALGGRTRLGVDGSLWLVDGPDAGVDAHGRVLASVTRRGVLRWLELGAGLGLHVSGDGLGPAAALTLRAVLPPLPRATSYLRYDAALISTDPGLLDQHALSLGLEWDF